MNRPTRPPEVARDQRQDGPSNRPPDEKQGAFDGLLALSPREKEVASLLALGMSDKEIATQLSISWHTARRHSERVLSKLRLSSRHLVAGALQTSLSSQGGSGVNGSAARSRSGKIE